MGIWQVILGTFRPLFEQGTRGVINWVFQDGPKLLRVLLIVFAVTTLVSSVVLYRRLSSAGSALFTALSERQETTAQPFKGLEALILSGIDATLQSSPGAMQVSDSDKRLFEKMSAASPIRPASNADVNQLLADTS